MNDLPYKLSEGITATDYGIWFGPNYEADKISLLFTNVDAIAEWYTTTPKPRLPVCKWSDVDERLRYQKGEPWCVTAPKTSAIHCYPADAPEVEWYKMCFALHKIAAILVDDAEGFQVLQDCIERFGDE